MNFLRFNLLKCLLIASLFCCSRSVDAQAPYNRISFKIDSLANVGLPKSALKEVDKLDELARKNNNSPQQIRAVIYRMTFRSYLEENALTAIIDRLKTDIDKSNYLVKPVLQSLLAQMYWNYYQQNRYQISQRSRLDKPGTDFTKWDLRTIINETSHLYDLSLHDAEKEQNTPVGVLDGVLEGDSTTRYLRPTLYDLLVQRAFDFFLTDEPSLTMPKLPFSLNDSGFFSDSRVFAGMKINTTDTSSTMYKGIKYLQQATYFHLHKKDEGALADIDLKRLGFIYAQSALANKDSLYLNALQQIIASYSSSPISADALVLQGKYYQQSDNLILAMKYYKQAASLFPASLGGRNADKYIEQINQRTMTAVTEDVNVPGKPLLALLKYRNIKKVKITIYKIWATQYNLLADMPKKNKGYNDGTVQTIEPVLNYLNKLKPVRVEDLQLPNLQDYRGHITEFKIDPLSSGIYVLMVDDPLNDDDTTLQLTTFKVCHLSFVHRKTPDNKIEITVMDRETGFPVPGVAVTIAETEHQTTDTNGTCLFEPSKTNNFSVKLTTATDTLYVGNTYGYSGIDNNIAGDVTRTILFTDRQIYRPGQTVYFKGIHVRVKLKDGTSSLLNNESLVINVLDNLRKPIMSIPVTTGDFGSFSGTFVIPQNLFNGLIFISTEKGDGSKPINVEEYKRPGFAVEFMPVNNSYKPNDSITIKGNVTAYSGYGISHVKVAYHIVRTTSFIDYRINHFNNYSQSFYSAAEIATDTVKTDNQGQFKIAFKAAEEKGTANKNYNYYYQITTDVTDGNGETRSARTAISVAENNLKILATVPAMALAEDDIKISAALNNLNGVAQSGNISLKISAVKGPGSLFKKRIWNKPDIYLLSREKYKKDFPEFAYGDEDQIQESVNGNTVTDININTDGKLPVFFDTKSLNKQPTGTYKISINASNLNGDTVSVASYLYLVNKPAKPQNLNNWVIQLNKKAIDNGMIRVLLSTGKNSHVLMEKYNGSKLVLSQWLNIKGEKQQVIKIPVNAGEQNISVSIFNDISKSGIHQLPAYFKEG